MTKKVPRLFNQFAPENYDLKLSLDPDAMRFSGTVSIRGKKTGRPSQRITLHAKELKITSATLTRHTKKGDEPLAIDRINTLKSADELRLHSSSMIYPGEYTIKLEFNGTLTDPMHGMYPCYFDHEGTRKKLIATQFESHHAREAFPCIDEPEAKATFTLVLETPEVGMTISNTPPADTQVKNGRMITSFKQTPKMSTYLLAFVYGELHAYQAKPHGNTSVTLYTTVAQNNQHLEFAGEVTTKALAFFEDFFGIPYPLEKSDQVALPDFESGAMENWGLITYRESCLLYDPESTSIETKQMIAEVICHELSHQWFGNLVTMQWWDDLWLNESFANMMAYVALDHIYPEWNIWEQYVVYDTNAALRRDSLAQVQPVRVEVNHPDEISTLFDPSIVYAKGGSLLRMLWQLVGSDAMRRGLRHYFTDHAYGNTKAQDLWDALEAASGMQISKMMNEWINRPGYPVVDVDYRPGDTSAELRQQRFVIGPNNDGSSSPWPLPLAATAEVEPAIITTPHVTVSVKQPGSLLLFNHESYSYYLPHYKNKDHVEQIIASIEDGSMSTIDRLQLLTAQTLLQRGMLATTVESLELLKAYRHETQEPVWNNIAGIIGEARRLINGNDDLETRLNHFSSELISEQLPNVGWEKAAGENAKQLRLRSLLLSLAASAQIESIHQEGFKRFRAMKTPKDVAPDVREVVYYIAARFGTESDFDQLLGMYRASTNADERDEIAGALMTTHDTKQIKTLLGMIKSDDVRQQDLLRWYARLMGNHVARPFTWQWLQDEWKWIESSVGQTKSFDFVPRYSAQVFSTESELQSFTTFFEPKKKIVILKRAIEIGIEDIQGRISWRGANEQPTAEWLKRNY